MIISDERRLELLEQLCATRVTDNARALRRVDRRGAAHRRAAGARCSRCWRHRAARRASMQSRSAGQAHLAALLRPVLQRKVVVAGP
jgi:hypothetical protein